MSFSKLKGDSLVEVLEAFGVDIPEPNSDVAMREALRTDGVTWEMWQKLQSGQAEVDEPVLVEETVVTKTTKLEDLDDMVLLKMDRENGHFEIYGYTFTKEHPFQLVKSDDADVICRLEEGFRMALPKEVKKYYG